MHKIPLYVPEPLPNAPRATWFTPIPAGQLFTESLPPNFFETEVERVADPKHAKAIVLQNNFKTLTKEGEAYIATYAALGEKNHIPVFIFSLGDFTDQVRFDARVYVLRFSLYRAHRGPRDISMPTTAEIPKETEFFARKKQGAPTVSFCGKASFPELRSWISYFIKSLFSIPARRIGIYWRRAMMRACAHSRLVTTNFIVRRTFSGLQKTIELEPIAARREFIESIRNADFVLTPKGDGNYSNRFLETLSYGRIPVLVDTDVALPLETEIDYSKIVVRVPMRFVHNTPQYIRAFYDALTEEEWEARQKLAREIFTTYLRQDSFFRHFFTNTVPKLTKEA